MPFWEEVEKHTVNPVKAVAKEVETLTRNPAKATKETLHKAKGLSFDPLNETRRIYDEHVGGNKYQYPWEQSSGSKSANPNTSATTQYPTSPEGYFNQIKPWMDYGRQRGEELFTQNPEYARQQQEMLSRYSNRMQGIADPEFDLMRERAYRGQQNTLAQNLHTGAAGAGRAGVRGAAAMGLQRQAMNKAQQEGRLLENDLMAAQMERQQQAEQTFADYLGQLSTAEDMRKMGQFGAEMGFGGLGAQVYGQGQGLEHAGNIASMPAPALPADKPWHSSFSGGNWMNMGDDLWNMFRDNKG